jgi:hypothetical protein
MLSIGELDSEIGIQLASITLDDMGSNKFSWPTIDDTMIHYAKVEFKDGKSSDAEDKVTNIINVEFTIRDNGYTTTSNEWNAPNNMRIAYPLVNAAISLGRTQYYSIDGVRVWGGRTKWRTFICSINTNKTNLYIG